MKFRKFLLFLFFYTLIFTNSYSIEPDVFVQSTVNRASAILSKNISKEEKIEKLQNRIKSLLQKILNPDHVETRLDDYVNNLIKWLRTRFKQTRSQCQIPKVWMEKLFYQGTGYYIQFNLHYYVDDIRLENCRRGERVNSEIHREILRHFHLNFPFDKTR